MKTSDKSLSIDSTPDELRSIKIACTYCKKTFKSKQGLDHHISCAHIKEANQITVDKIVKKLNKISSPDRNDEERLDEKKKKQ